jgi:penicillin-binding protein 1C
MEYYYKKVHPEYKALPPFLTNCKGLNNNSGHRIESIYPQNGTKVYIPLDWNSKHTKLIFKAAHQNDKAELFWYIDDKLIAKTKETHEIEVYLKPGKYNLLLLDNFGESINVHFEVESKDKASY